MALLIVLGRGGLFAQEPKIILPAQPGGGRGPAGPGLHLLRPGDAPKPFPEAKAIPQPQNNAELAAAIERLAGELANAGKFSGSVLLAADGKTVEDGAWGLADRVGKIANKTDTAYDVGSIGKLFTQIAILQLGESGKLNLDDHFGKYLTDYPDPTIAGKVTIRQLLLQPSGIPDFLSHVTPETKLDSIVELKDFSHSLLFNRSSSSRARPIATRALVTLSWV